MNNKNYRHKNGLNNKDKCYLCNNLPIRKCCKCKGKICNDCIDNKIFCYKCNILEIQ